MEISTAKYVIQVSLQPGKFKNYTTGSFDVFYKNARFGASEESMFFCPESGCLGVSRINHDLPKEEIERFEKLLEKGIDRVYEDPVFKNKFLGWFMEKTPCPVCSKPFSRMTAASSYGFRMDRKRIATRLKELYLQLGGEADVVLIIHKHPDALRKAKRDTRSKMPVSQDTIRETLEKARDRQYVQYAKARIDKDSAIRGLQSTFEALIDA